MTVDKFEMYIVRMMFWLLMMCGFVIVNMLFLPPMTVELYMLYGMWIVFCGIMMIYYQFRMIFCDSDKSVVYGIKKGLYLLIGRDIDG